MLEAEAFRAINPIEFNARFLREGVRPDSRTLLELRPVSLSIDNGLVMSRIGSTAVTCKSTAFLSCDQKPLPSPLEVTVSILPLCSASAGFIPTQDSFALGSQLRDILLPLLLEDVAERGWMVAVDIIVLSDDGNIPQVSYMAALLSLCAARLPRLNAVEDPEVEELRHTVPGVGSKVVGEHPSGSLPIMVGYAVINTNDLASESWVILDPTEEEERISTSSVSVTWKGNAVSLNLTGAPIPSLTIKKVLAHSKTVGEYCREVVEKALKLQK